MAASDIEQRLQMMKLKIAELETMLAAEKRKQGGRSRQESLSQHSSGVENVFADDAGGDNEDASTQASGSGDNDGGDNNGGDDDDDTSEAPPQFPGLTDRAYVGRDCPVGMVACDPAKELCPDDLGTNVFNSEGDECMPRKMLRQQQRVQVTTIPDDREVRVKLGLLRDIVQNAAMINSRLLSISRADVSCDSVNSMFPEDSVEDRRAFCSTLVTADGLTKCEMDAQNKCIERDLTEIRRNAIQEMDEHDKKSRGIVSRMGDAASEGYAAFKSFLKSLLNTVTSIDTKKNPLLQLITNNKMSYSDMMATAALFATAITYVIKTIKNNNLSVTSVNQHIEKFRESFNKANTTQAYVTSLYTLLSPFVPNIAKTQFRQMMKQ
jgi:hypothetical protein